MRVATAASKIQDVGARGLWQVRILEPAEVPTLQEDSDSSADSGSETDDSVDTQSETEVVALPLEA